MTIIKLFLLLILCSVSLQADVIMQSKEQNIQLIGLPFYEDKSNSLSLSDVQKQNFSVHKNKVASFGFTQSRYWFKVVIDPQEDAKLNNWWLNVSYPLLDKLDLYICDEDGKLLELKKSGKARPFDEREAKSRYFLFRLDTSKKQVLYLSVNTDSSMQVPMSIQTSQSLISTDQYLLVLAGLYYGIFILIFFYNLSSLLYTRKKNYLLYLLFISSFGLYQLSLDGLGIRFLWSDWDWMVTHGNGTMMGFMILVVILFSRDFLKIKEFAPVLDKILLFFAFFMSIVMINAIFRPYGDVILFLAGASIVLPPLLVLAGIISYRKKFYPARFYILGWGFFLGGSILFAMNKFAFIEGYTFLSYAQQVGSALEMIFLSWALADLQKQSEREYLQKLSGLNTFLEEKVQTSIEQLRKNDQVLIEKSRLAAMGEMIEQIAHQWRQPLNSLALINQNLYFKVQLSNYTANDCIEAHDKINDQLQYMSQTIDDFRDFSQPHKDKESFIIEEVIQSALNLSEGSLKYAKIKTHQFSSHQHEIYGMRHEMMQVFMNMIKNVQDIVLAHKYKDIWIKFFVEEDLDNIKILIKDNAGGIEEEKVEKIFEPYFSTKKQLEGTGIGLYMSKEIIEKSMLGSISVTNQEEGAVFSILLPKVREDKS
ncbi:sensor histidine kinase [Sulfurimonas sp. MAG313]|nr:sensor histidine kinase [Sulfurimonas sp. MAG313]MDF1880344.1 sensor histidine kinase [Sulfurimonas sp. MAG313]